MGQCVLSIFTGTSLLFSYIVDAQVHEKNIERNVEKLKHFFVN